MSGTAESPLDSAVRLVTSVPIGVPAIPDSVSSLETSVPRDKSDRDTRPLWFEDSTT